MNKDNVITDRTIRIALVGCGRIAYKHLEAIQKHHDNLELVAIVDNDGKALDHFATENQLTIPAFTDLQSMFNKVDVDIVSLCTPSGLHPEQAIECAHANKHVISEKPMATSWEDALSMVQACEKADVQLFVVKQNRLNATIQLLKQAIDEGRFGQIYHANVNVFWTRPQDYYDQAEWRGTWKMDGGALMNQASHYIDLLHWLLGPVKRLHAMIATQARDIEVEDSAVINLQWKDGALGAVNVSMLTFPQNYEGSITILGENGTVRIGGVAVNQIQHWQFAEPRAEDHEIKENNYQTESIYGFGHPSYYDNVIKVLRGSAEPLTDGREGLKSLELLIAAYQSAQQRKEITLPLT